MPRQQFDHSAFIEGTLRSYQNVGWDTQVVLDQGPRSLWLMQAKHINHSSGIRGIELQIEHYRKSTNSGPFGEPEKFHLKEESVRILFDYLQRQQALEGIDLGSEYIAIPFSGVAAGLSTRQRSSLGSLIRNLFEQQEISQLLEQGLLTEETINHISVASQHVRYKSAVAELRRLLDTETTEQTYQDWFVEHPWVFGTHYVRHVETRRIGLHEIADVLLQTVDGYLDLFELKRPDAEVLSFDRGRSLYFFSREASSAVAQCAQYIKTVEENRHMLASVEHLFFLKPRARIVIGHSNGWNQDKKDALRTLNASLHFIEVVTYDQVLAMAQQLIDQYEQSMENEMDDEIPF